MSNYFLNDELSKKTSISGSRSWAVRRFSAGAAMVLLFLISLRFTSKRNRTNYKTNKPIATSTTIKFILVLFWCWG